jgi:hypothetical protein
LLSHPNLALAGTPNTLDAMFAPRTTLGIACSLLAGALCAACSKSNGDAFTAELQSASLTRARSDPSPADGAGASVAAGTPVRMYDGTTKPIERLAIGDRVLSYSPRRGMVAGTVADIASHDGARELVRINLGHGGHARDGALAMTRAQQVYASGQWTSPGELATGSRLLAVDRGKLEPPLVSTVEPVPGPVSTYELRVVPEHDFFADGILVRDGEPETDR